MTENVKEGIKEMQEKMTECSDVPESIVVENKLTEIVQENKNGVEGKQAELTCEGDKLEHVKIEMHEEGEKNMKNKSISPKPTESLPEILINQPLCADYGSSSDTESDNDSSSDSDSDSDSSTVDSDSDSSSQISADDLQDINDDDINGKTRSQQKDDLDLSDLPPIEHLRITVPEEKCQEIGTVSSIVNTLVVVQAYKDTPALDIDTVLFLDMGQKSMGRIFDVLGPVSEPIYTVRFNNIEEIAENNITKGRKVYCAPKTEYTSFVFVSELMKMKGSDASWKNNEEPPPEYQDFSDDEEENKFKHGGISGNNSYRTPPSDNSSRKKVKGHQGQPNFPYWASDYRNPFALGRGRNQRFDQAPRRYPPRHQSPHPPHYPSQSNLFYDAQNDFLRGGMMGQPALPPPYPNYPLHYYPSQQYPSYPMQQFVTVPMAPPPPPPVNSMQSHDNAKIKSVPRALGAETDSPSQNG